MKRAGEAVLSVLETARIPDTNIDAMADNLAVIASAAKACAPEKKKSDALMKGISTIATVFEAQKYAMVEEIRKNSQREGSAANSEKPYTDEGTSTESDQVNKKTTIIQQQTNVIQNGDNNVNVTNNGTINFKF